MRPTGEELGMIKTDDAVGRIAAGASREVRGSLRRLRSRYGGAKK